MSKYYRVDPSKRSFIYDIIEFILIMTTTVIPFIIILFLQMEYNPGFENKFMKYIYDILPTFIIIILSQRLFPQIANYCRIITAKLFKVY